MAFVASGRNHGPARRQCVALRYCQNSNPYLTMATFDPIGSASTLNSTFTFPTRRVSIDAALGTKIIRSTKRVGILSGAENVA